MKRQAVGVWLSAVVALVPVHFASPVFAQGGPVGACCFQRDCEVLSQHVCGLLGGTFLGHDTDCSPPPCDNVQGVGACCFYNFTQGEFACLEGTESECHMAGGDFLGLGTTCNGNACSGGPCCLNDATCVANVDPIECASIGGTFMDWDISCNAVTCKVKVPCPADLTGDAEVGPADLAALLATWGVCPGCPADVDVSGSVGAEDLAELLAGWGACG